MKNKIYNIVIFIISIILVLIIISIYEFGICNYEYYKKNAKFNISIFRIICYLIFLTLSVYFAKKYNQNVVNELLTNKLKKYAFIICAILCIISSFIILWKQKAYSTLTSMYLLLVILNIFLFIIYLSKNYITNLLLTALTFGILFSISVDFNHEFDEKKHFMSAFNLAMGNFNFSNPITDYNLNNISHFLDYKDFNIYYGITYIPNITNEVDTNDIPSLPTIYSPILYLPSAFAILIATLLHASIADIYIIGRIANLFTFIGLAICTLKILPYKKDIFQVVFMLPLVICIGATYSIDSITLGLVSIFIAICLKIYSKNKILNLNDIIILLIAIIILWLAKSLAYIAIALVFFIMPIRKTLKENKNYKNYIILISMIIIMLIFSLLFYVLITKVQEDPRGGNTNTYGQLLFISRNPINSIKLFINHILNTLFSFSWLENISSEVFFDRFSEQIHFVNFIFIFYIAITDKSHTFKLKHKILFISAFILCFIMISLALYISFTPIGNENILGCQARYIIPIFPLLLMCISFTNIEYNSIKNRTLKINYFTTLLVIISLIDVII